ncbi:alkyl/aryl-sulfatase [Cupriavidus metallidurans]|uniref:alkyl/aryl-sulfatase n=2 Tax=Cupriavidus TaxID=106589 RepID=UPI001BFCB08D|nr:alkyl sulfatase dimerization domain-containing protein [Cupriavidus metallidurans]QWC90930.1 MBL fold metallo-hydrolase [Cupriavidus metallidurans]
MPVLRNSPTSSSRQTGASTPARVAVWLATFILAHGSAVAQVAPKPATAATRAANAAVLKELPFQDRQEFEDAQRGLIAAPDLAEMRAAHGNVGTSLATLRAQVVGKNAPDTVNPSLWRNSQLLANYGLYKVTDRIYQVRSLDLANMTFIQGDTGWIVMDTLSYSETARAAYDLVTKHLGQRPIVAVVFSHSHGDHYAGIRGIVTDAEIQSGKVRIIAPEGFMEEAVSENVIAGNAMSRRAVYMGGAPLPVNPQGRLAAGLGVFAAPGTMSLVPPTDTISKDGQELVIDGVKMVFQLTPGTEAPAEMNTWFPQFKAMWMAENTTNTLHNLLTLRGAQVRDALKWVDGINATITSYGKDIEVKFQSHHWPMWGHDRIIDYFEKQRDAYRYIHDQSVRLMNEGYVGTEIAEAVKLPPELAQYWPNRGYWGTVKHNTRAVYQRYLGWYDSNPSSLDPLPPTQAAKKYVEYMGGEAAILARAHADFDKGEYRWLAEALRQVVFANPGNKEARELLADTYEQLGYQAEAPSWRAEYLQGANELRNGVPNIRRMQSASPDVVRAMAPEMLFSYMAVRLNGPKAAGKHLVLNVVLTDVDQQYTLEVKHGVLNHFANATPRADATIKLSKAVLARLQQAGPTSIEQAIAAGELRIEGKQEVFGQLLGMLDTFPTWFNIVTPNPEPA